TSWSSRGATTMKMMSSTRTTSTSGVTFMSGRMAPTRVVLRNPLTSHLRTVRFRPPLDRVGELPRRRRERALVARDRVREVVETEHGGDGHREPERRLDERLADAGRNRPETTPAARPDPLAGRDDADDGAEQTDERRHGADRREDGKAATQIGAQRLERALDVAAGTLRGTEAVLVLRRARVAVRRERGLHEAGEMAAWMLLGL